MKKLVKEEFISKAKEIHSDKYDYSKVVYVNSRTKVCIICPEHGEFWQTPGSHLNGNGCKKCSDDGFNAVIERDKRKLRKCEENGVKLLYYSNLGIEYPYYVFEDKEKLLKAII